MNNIQNTIDALKQAQSSALPEDIIKSFTQSAGPISGLTFYDLAGPAKEFTPYETPLRNMIPRDDSGAGTQANWKVITKVNVKNQGIGLREAKRGSKIEQSTNDYFAKYCFMGLNNSVTFEAEMAAKGYDNLRARAAKDLLSSLMVQEEFLDYAGNGTLNLGTTPNPVLTLSAIGGNLGAQTLSVICVALAQKGYQQLEGYNQLVVGESLDLATAQLDAFTVENDIGDNSAVTMSGGVARKSSNVTVVIGSGSTNSIVATVALVPGAFGYAWFFGVAGAEKLGAVSHLNTVVIKDVAVGTQLASSLPATDNSKDQYVYDGILTQIFKAGSGSYVKAMATSTDGLGTKLTSDGASGIKEINEALAHFKQLYKLSPDVMIVSSGVATQITDIVVKAGHVVINGQLNGATTMTAGIVVDKYKNKSNGNIIDIVVHPNAAPGTILFFTKKVPYTLSNTPDLLVKKLRRDYYQIEWPLRVREYETGVYFDGVLQCFFPQAFGVIYNIAE